ncbi:GH3 auxin-responsive promoter family protein [Kiloniella sp.]|uniref:GH3 auxin-responsive promoter family protein n=1 Tax=Kiloniella sp. TaxID=1938587 RepID=UPI003B01A244
MSFVFNLLIHLKMVLVRYLSWAPLMRQSRAPRTVQEKLLLAILKKNRNTEFGKAHKFSSIKTYAEYKRLVSVKFYEDLRPLIEKQERKNTPSLNASQPIMYAQTSGTTGRSKFIPILRKTVSQYRRSQHCVAYAEYLGIPGVFDGKILAIVSPAVEGSLDTGTPYGSMSGLIYQSMPKFVNEKYVVPPQIFEIKDSDLKYFLITAFALSEKNITLIATANPSTLLKIAEILKNRFNDLVEVIAEGNRYGLKPNPIRARELRATSIFGDLTNPLVGSVSFENIWPNLKSVTTWTGGNCAIQIPNVKKLLKQSTKIVEMGYLSSEFRGSITVDVLNNKSIPTIHENFFEFVERDQWGEDDPDFLTVDMLGEGQQYYVVVTTQNGLFRYFINDIVEVDGWFNNTPTIRFVQKGRGVTNLTGEKLYENHVLEAIRKLKIERSLDFNFFMMLGCPDKIKYQLFIEEDPESELDTDIVLSLERYLSEINIEFKAKRESGRLKKTSVVFLKEGTAEAYRNHCIAEGQSEGQFKLLHLQEVKDCSFNFDQHRCK